MGIEVHHAKERQQFTAVVDGVVAVIDYDLRDGIMTLLHTGVPPAIGGRGIAADLTRAALQHARAQGWRVRPHCSYAAAYLRRHPEYADLLAA